MSSRFGRISQPGPVLKLCKKVNDYGGGGELPPARVGLWRVEAGRNENRVASANRSGGSVCRPIGRSGAGLE